MRNPYLMTSSVEDGQTKSVEGIYVQTSGGCVARDKGSMIRMKRDPEPRVCWSKDDGKAGTGESSLGFRVIDSGNTLTVFSQEP